MRANVPFLRKVRNIRRYATTVNISTALNGQVLADVIFRSKRGFTVWARHQLRRLDAAHIPIKWFCKSPAKMHRHVFLKAASPSVSQEINFPSLFAPIFGYGHISIGDLSHSHSFVLTDPLDFVNEILFLRIGLLPRGTQQAHGSECSRNCFLFKFGSITSTFRMLFHRQKFEARLPCSGQVNI